MHSNLQGKQNTQPLSEPLRGGEWAGVVTMVTRCGRWRLSFVRVTLAPDDTHLCQGNTSSWWYSPLSGRNVCCQCRRLSAQTTPRLSRARLGSVKTTGIIISTNWIRDGLLVLTFTSWPRSGWPHRRTFYQLILASFSLFHSSFMLIYIYIMFVYW